MRLITSMKPISGRTDIIFPFVGPITIKNASFLAGWTLGPKNCAIAFHDRRSASMNANQYDVLYLKSGESWYPAYIPIPLTWEGEIKIKAGEVGTLLITCYDGGDAFYGFAVVGVE